MKRINKLAAMFLVLTLTTFSPVAAFAEEVENLELTDVTDVTDVTDATEELDVIEETENDESLEVEGKGKQKPWKAERETIKQEKANIEVLKDEVEVEIESLESQLEEAELIGDATLVETLKIQIEALKTEKDSYQSQMKQSIDQMKQIMKSKYSQKELSELSLVGQILSSEGNVQVIPVENIFVKNRDVKFDTPPVIKYGRTLIPVRAIVESTGATVDWNGDSQEVTISKDDKIIIFNLSENKVYVNGIVAEIDVPAEIMNNRTMVPIRFVAENFGLNVQWEQDSQTISIDEETIEPVETVEDVNTETTQDSIIE